MLLPLVFTAYTLQGKDQVTALQMSRHMTIFMTGNRLIPELWCASAVYDVVDLCAAWVEVGLQGENHVVGYAEALANDWKGVSAVLLIHRNAHHGL